MHEYSIMADIVKAALASLEKYDVENVEAVFLEVGELTFLNPVQLKFCYNILVKDNLLVNSSLRITQKKAEIQCKSCGYKGNMKERPQEDHFRVPIISCPKCEGEIKLLSGRECTIKSIKMNIKDEEEKKEEEGANNTN